MKCVECNRQAGTGKSASAQANQITYSVRRTGDSQPILLAFSIGPHPSHKVCESVCVCVHHVGKQVCVCVFV